MVRVYLQYPWKFVDSSYYRNLVNSSPVEIEYINKNSMKSIDSKIGFNINKFLKSWARRIITLLKTPNLLYTRKGDYDLIHCAHCLSLNKKTPWVVDFERYETLSINGYYARSKKGSEKIKKMLLKDNCKKILPWTNSARESLIKYIDDERINKKIDLLPFALPFKEYPLKRDSKKIKILFVSRYFEPKGGYFALEVMEHLTKKYKNVYGVVVSETPQEVLEKYKSNDKIEFHNLMGQEELFEKIYSTSDILFYPGFSDTFGFALVEALMFKLPLISFEGFARDEIVIEGKNGFIIKRGKGLSENWIEARKNFDKKYVGEAIKKTEKLILDKSLREKMGNYGHRMIKTGKFSVVERNKKLKQIYGEALR